MTAHPKEHGGEDSRASERGTIRNETSVVRMSAGFNLGKIAKNRQHCQPMMEACSEPSDQASMACNDGKAQFAATMINRHPAAALAQLLHTLSIRDETVRTGIHGTLSEAVTHAWTEPDL